MNKEVIGFGIDLITLLRSQWGPWIFLLAGGVLFYVHQRSVASWRSLSGKPALASILRIISWLLFSAVILLDALIFNYVLTGWILGVIAFLALFSTMIRFRYLKRLPQQSDPKA